LGWFQVTEGQDFSCGDTVEHGGYSYPTVEIGNQCWFAEDLQYDSGCIENDWASGNACDTGGYDGFLYQWPAAMDGSNEERAQGICPNDWHIPTDTDWHILENYLATGDCDPLRDDWECVPAGDQLRDSEVEGWCYSSPCGESGFNALPSGGRLPDGSLMGVDEDSLFWSSSTDNSDIYIRVISVWEQNTVSRFAMDTPSFGISVRCIETLEIEHTLTYIAGEGGSIIGEANQTVSFGEDGSEVTASPNEGYEFDEWSDGVTSESRTDTNVTEDIEVTALFSEEEELLPEGPEWTFQIETTGNSQDFIFYTEDAEMNIYWGDGVNEPFIGSDYVSHTYSNQGTYNITLEGTATRVAFCNSWNCANTTPELLYDILTPIPAEFGLTSAKKCFLEQN